MKIATTYTTAQGNTIIANEAMTHFYMIDKTGKKYRLTKHEYEQILKEDEIERRHIAEQTKDAQAELDKTPCFVDPMADLNKPAILNEYGCVDCSECHVKPCVHRDCMRRNPRSEGGLAECPRLKVKAEEEEAEDPELEQIKEEIPGIEDAEAELEKNIRKEKKAAKPRRSKDIAWAGDGINAPHTLTLTTKQVDFIRHLSDTCFWENGLDSNIWVDVLCEEIGGQFAEKPMTVGAMISTLCEKGLGSRCRDTSRKGKPIAFSFTELGKKVAGELGLE